MSALETPPMALRREFRENLVGAVARAVLRCWRQDLTVVRWGAQG